MPLCASLFTWQMMALPSCTLSSAINYTLLSLQEECSLHPVTHTHTCLRAHTRRTQRDRHLQSVCHLFCWHLRPHGIVGETAICCRQGWIGRGKQAQCIMLLFSVALCCVKCCAVVFVVFSSTGVTPLQYSNREK